MNKEIVMEANSDISNPMHYWLLYQLLAGLSELAWVLLVFTAAIVGLVIKPFPNLSYC